MLEMPKRRKMRKCRKYRKCQKCGKNREIPNFWEIILMKAVQPARGYGRRGTVFSFIYSFWSRILRRTRTIFVRLSSWRLILRVDSRASVHYDCVLNATQGGLHESAWLSINVCVLVIEYFLFLIRCFRRTKKSIFCFVSGHPMYA